jgi:hypothetical protein
MASPPFPRQEIVRGKVKYQLPKPVSGIAIFLLDIKDRDDFMSFGHGTILLVSDYRSYLSTLAPVHLFFTRSKYLTTFPSKSAEFKCKCNCC